MEMSKQLYQKTVELLDTIQEHCAQGICLQNPRDSLIDVSSLVFKIRQELNDGLIIDDGE